MEFRVVPSAFASIRRFLQVEVNLYFNNNKHYYGLGNKATGDCLLFL